MSVNELGSASKALLERINMSFGYAELGNLISWASVKTGLRHGHIWWYRRLVALALEGHIDAKVHRNGDKLAILFKKKEAENQ